MASEELVAVKVALQVHEVMVVPVFAVDLAVQAEQTLLAVQA